MIRRLHYFHSCFALSQKDGFGHQAHEGCPGTGCKSPKLINPIYGGGEEPGNEAGYIVGMSTCYPQLGLSKYQKGNYYLWYLTIEVPKCIQKFRGLFDIMVADSYSFVTASTSWDTQLDLCCTPTHWSNRFFSNS